MTENKEALANLTYQEMKRLELLKDEFESLKPSHNPVIEAIGFIASVLIFFSLMSYFEIESGHFWVFFMLFFAVSSLQGILYINNRNTNKRVDILYKILASTNDT